MNTDVRIYDGIHFDYDRDHVAGSILLGEFRITSLNKEIMDWLEESEILGVCSFSHPVGRDKNFKRFTKISFYYEEDAMAFTLAWS